MNTSREDYEAASNLDAKDRQEFYVNTKSGAESGWDFSSRWYIVDDGTNEGNMSHINTRYVIPVDLNSFVCMNNYLLSEMFLLVGNKEKASFYRDKFLSWREAIKEVCTTTALVINRALPVGFAIVFFH